MTYHHTVDNTDDGSTELSEHHRESKT
jgi:hypothetical protein